MLGYEIFCDREGNIELLRRRVRRGIVSWQHLAWIRKAKP